MEEHLPGHRTKTVYRKSSKCKLREFKILLRGCGNALHKSFLMFLVGKKYTFQFL